LETAVQTYESSIQLDQSIRTRSKNIIPNQSSQPVSPVCHSCFFHICLPYTLGKYLSTPHQRCRSLYIQSDTQINCVFRKIACIYPGVPSPFQVEDCATVVAQNNDPSFGKIKENGTRAVLSWIEKEHTGCFSNFSDHDAGTTKVCHFQSHQCRASKTCVNPDLRSKKTECGVLCKLCVNSARDKKECDRIVKLCQRIDMVEVLETMQHEPASALTDLSVTLMKRSYSGENHIWWMQEGSGCGEEQFTSREVAKWWLSLPMEKLHWHVLVPSELDRDFRLLPTAYCILLLSA
jgi:hypothetical protein